MKFIKTIIGTFVNDKLSQNLSLQLAEIGILIGLSAIVAMFISINKQHTIQKCKELLWDMELLINCQDKTSKKEELKSKFKLYENLMNEPLFIKFKPLYFNFNNLVIIIITFALLQTVRMLLSIGYYSLEASKEPTIITITILLMFSFLLLTLLSINLTAPLDKSINLLNGNKKTSLKTNDIAATITELLFRFEICDNNFLLQGNINMPLPLTNIEISPLIRGRSYEKIIDNNGHINKYNESIDFLCSPSHFIYNNENNLVITSKYYEDNYQKEVTTKDIENNKIKTFLTGTIGIVNKARPCPRNFSGSPSNPFSPLGYNYDIYFNKLTYDSNNIGTESKNHTEISIDISMYDELDVYCYFMTSEGTAHVEYGTIKLNSKIKNVIALKPKSISFSNTEHEHIPLGRKMFYDKIKI